MKIKVIKWIGAALIVLVWAVIAVMNWFSPSTEISISERRKLKQMPQITKETILSGEFSSNFEEYALDQFKYRDQLRMIKSVFNTYVLMEKDVNDIYIAYHDWAVKMEYPLNESSIDHAKKVFNKIYDKYLSKSNTTNYICVIPDKNYYCAEDTNHLSMDYDKLFEEMNSMEWLNYIDITNYLDISSFYNTDNHWKQDSILLVAEKLCYKMNYGSILSSELKYNVLDDPFYGVLYKQAALPISPDEITYITNDTIDQATVFDYETNSQIPVYDINSDHMDMYDVYLGGAKALLKIENPNAKTDKELIIFRDSFGSSIAPLMIESYKTITLVDLRYISSDIVGRFIDFENQDVLFLYSTSVLNNSYTLK